MNPLRPGPSDLWDSELGPFYLPRDVGRWLGVSVSETCRRVRARQIVGLLTSDGILLLPAFQFNEHGVVPTHLAAVLTAMDFKNVDPWSDALLLRESSDDLAGRTLIEALRDGDAEHALAFAIQLGQPIRDLFPSQPERAKTIDAPVRTLDCTGFVGALYP